MNYKLTFIVTFFLLLSFSAFGSQVVVESSPKSIFSFKKVLKTVEKQLDSTEVRQSVQKMRIEEKRSRRIDGWAAGVSAVAFIAMFILATSGIIAAAAVLTALALKLLLAMAYILVSWTLIILILAGISKSNAKKR